MTKAVRILVWVLPLLIVTGCSTDAPPTTTPTSPAVTSESPPSSPSPPEQSVLSMGNGLTQLYAIANPLPGGEEWRAIALVDPHTMLVSLPGGDNHRPALLDLETEELTVIGEETEGSIFAADADDQSVVWVTTTAQDQFSMPWTLHRYSRASRTTEVIAEAPDVGVDPVPAAPDGTRPTLANGRVYLAAVSSVSDGTPKPSIYSVPVEGGDLRPEIEDAFGGAAGPTGLIYQRADPGFSNWEIHRAPLDGPGDQLVASGGARSRYSGYAADDDGHFIFQRMDGNQCTVLVGVGDEPVQEVARNGCARKFAYYPRASGQFALFSYALDGGGYAPQLYEFATGDLAALDIGALDESPLVYDDVLAWPAPEGPDRGKVLVARVG